MNTLCSDIHKYLGTYLSLNDEVFLSSVDKYFNNTLDRKDIIKKLKNISCNKLYTIIDNTFTWCNIEFIKNDIENNSIQDKAAYFSEYIHELSSELLMASNIYISRERWNKRKKWYNARMCNSHSLFTEPTTPRIHKIHKIYRYKMVGTIKYAVNNSLAIRALIY
jgi:hypothetical protein